MQICQSVEEGVHITPQKVFYHVQSVAWCYTKIQPKLTIEPISSDKIGPCTSSRFPGIGLITLFGHRFVGGRLNSCLM
jgi:hypothetical protein